MEGGKHGEHQAKVHPVVSDGAVHDGGTVPTVWGEPADWLRDPKALSGRRMGCSGGTFEVPQEPPEPDS